jgi:hypothetical protein
MHSRYFFGYSEGIFYSESSVVTIVAALEVAGKISFGKSLA